MKQTTINRYITLFFIMFFWNPITNFSQSDVDETFQLDSLYNAWDNPSLADSTRVQSMLEYVEVLLVKGNTSIDSLKKLSRRNLRRFKQSANPAAQVGSYNLEARLLINQDSLLKAKKILEDCIAMNLPYTRYTSSMYLNLASLLNTLGDYELVTHYALELDHIASNEPSINGKDLYSIKHLIGAAFLLSRQLDKAEKALLECLNIVHKEKVDSIELSFLLHNIGETYKQKSDYTQAEEWMRKSLDIQKEKAPWDAPLTYSTLIDILLSQDKLKEAQQVIKELKLYIQNKETSAFSQCITKGWEGEIALRADDHQSAKIACLKALDIAMENNFLEQERAACDCLYRNAMAVGNYQNAVDYLQRSHTAQDSLFNQEKLQRITRLEMQHHFDKEQTLIAAQQEQERLITQTRIRRNRNLALFISIILALALSFLLVQIRNARRQKQLNLLLDTSNYSLAFTNRRLQTTLDSLSHDILSKLNLVISTGKVFGPETSTSSAFQQYFVTTNTAVKQVKQYCLDLLQYAHTGDSVQTQAATTDTQKLLQKLVTEYQSKLSTRQIEVNISDLPALHCESTALQQIFRNLLENAIRHIPNHSSSGEISFIYENNGHNWFIGIRDNGSGISKDKMDTIFERGLSYAEGGHGHGLSIVKGIVSSWGGDVWAENNVQGGATIWFSAIKHA